jgi:predicted TPR repeat methyltransferase
MSRRAEALERALDEGEALARAKRHSEAEARAREIVALQPRSARAHHLLALAMRGLQRHHEALASARDAIRHDRVNGRYHYTEALCLAELGENAEAIASLRRALRFEPRLAEARARLVGLLEADGRGDEAQSLLRQARDEGDAASAVQNELALALLERGLTGEGIAALRRSVEIDPGFLPGWRNLGKVLYVEHLRAGEQATPAARDDLIRCFERILALDSGNQEIAHLRDCVRGARVERPPDAYVEAFFDRFAARFDERVLGELQYGAPAEAARMLEPWLAGRPGLRVADLGCGTGLSGDAWRPFAGQLVGVDLSANMLERARLRGVYDVLVRNEIGDFLASAPAASFDLLVLLDVFIYVGELGRILTAAAGALAAGGRIVFTIEEKSGGDFELQASGRYAHDRGYALAKAESAGLRFIDARAFAIRTEGGKPVPAVLFAFEKR